MKQKAVLLTQSQIANYSGSEMVTLELAEGFTNLGWRVTVLTHHAGAPILEEFNKIPYINVVTTGSKESEELSIHNFSVIWIHHYTLTTKIIEQLNSTAFNKLPLVYFNHMSYISPIEDMVFPWFESKVARAIFFNSEETRDEILKRHSLEKSKKYQLLCNPAPNSFRNKISPTKRKESPKAILVVSNHPPLEIIEAASMLENEGNEVDFIGRVEGGMEARVTPGLLQRYDVIVSIGKTVQYALLMNKPVYCYDRFGGPGYLTEEQLSTARYHNFSGRGFQKKTAKSIALEIQEGYSETVASQSSIAEHLKGLELEESLSKILEIDPPETKKHRKTTEEDISTIRSFVSILQDTVPKKSTWQRLAAQNNALERRIVDLSQNLADESRRARSYGAMYGQIIHSRLWKLMLVARRLLSLKTRASLFARRILEGPKRRVYVSKSKRLGAYVSVLFEGNGDYVESAEKLAKLQRELIDWDELVARKRTDKVSIIVLVYSGAEMTRRCVDSLFEVQNSTEFELILVCNGAALDAAQATIELKEKYPEIKLVTINENTNFALGNSIGFQYSTGKEIIFLNNDTYVTDGWLDRLVGGYRESRKTVAQPVLLYPDGAVQNIGIVFSSKSSLGYPMYAGYSGENPRIIKNRDVRAVTGACLLMSAKDYAQLKGFDAAYINGQEDVDLCMRLGGVSSDIGAVVADSVVYHDESRSPGRGRYVKDNRTLFIERWGNKIISDDIGRYHNDGYTVIGWQSDEGAVDQQLAVHTPILKLNNQE